MTKLSLDMTDSTQARRLLAHSWFIDGVGDAAHSPFGSELPTGSSEFLRLLPESGFTCWVRESSGLVGWGELARFTASGPDRAGALDRQWREFLVDADITDEVGLFGSGPVTFGSLAFSDDSREDSVLVVPRIILGRLADRVWVTTLRFAGEDDGDALPLAPSDIRPPAAPRVRPGALGPDAWGALVGRVAASLAGADGLDGAASDAARKVVLARDAVVTDEQPFDLRYPLGYLNTVYPSCWTFHIDGMIGATPELLISLREGEVRSRVLAGTYRSTGDRASDLVAARALLGAKKDSTEHAYAIESLKSSLAPLVEDLHADEAPFLLELANVIHLASDVRGERSPGAGSSLQIADAVHPTAAVGGTPTTTAVRVIAAEESMDRGRYAGPVGWMDADGEGQWGIALRCGQFLDPSTVRLFAGAGIMPDSTPATEVAETAAKFAPMLGALGVREASPLEG